jgi:DNA-binding NarL/FixJ family response regulator
MNHRARVLIADDHQVFAEALRGLLEPEFEVVAIVADGRAMLQAAQEKRPDVIVADVSMPSLNGIEAAARLAGLGVTAKVVFLTMHREIDYARRALEAGAAGYVLKHAAAAELVAALRDALQGRTYVSPMIAGELFQSYRQSSPETQEPSRRLTVRQREVLQLVAEGRSSKEIAALLKISVRTAEAHKARLLHTLGLDSTAELVHYAIRNGVISV